MKVFKYNVHIDDEWNKIRIPCGAIITLVAVQKELSRTLQFWVFVDEEATEQWREFRVFGTGHRIGEGEYNHKGFGKKYEYYPIGSCLDASGVLVWHLIERM